MLRSGSRGAKLFPWRPYEAIAAFRRQLALLSVRSADQFGFKAFRAGRATELAKEGCSLTQVLLAGEWRSAAYLRYLSEDAFDAAGLIATIGEGSSDEDAG